MEKTKVYGDHYGIHLLQPDGGYYPVAWWQIENDGVERWRAHLGEKSWFTEEMDRGFCDLWEERIAVRHYM